MERERRVGGVRTDVETVSNSSEVEADVREAIMVDLQGFPNDLAAPDAAKRLRQVAPWATYLRECFLKGGKQAGSDTAGNY